MYDTKPFSQADQRSFRVFRDQHGRKWGAIIENKTQAPCGPFAPQFSAPLVPPQKYIELVDGPAGELRIRYDLWLEDEDRAREEYHEALRQQAFTLYRDQAVEALKNPPPALLSRVGDPPQPRERILAAKAGDPWVLGLTDQRPKWADKFFPRAKEADEFAFLREGAEEEDEPASAAEAEYPVHEGFGRWRLSDGSVVKGKKEEAEAAEAALHEAEPALTGAAHPSWTTE